MSKPWAVVLAAGEGTRMKSSTPKVLHNICGQAMVNYVIKAASPLVDKQIIVVGYGGDLVQRALGENFFYAWQKQQLGTGHALSQCLPFLPSQGETLVLCGDTPLLRSETLQRLVQQKSGQDGVILTAEPVDPTGYGRIIRDDAGNVLKIVEEKDADPSEKRVHEINAGSYIFSNEVLHEFVPLLGNLNAKGEYYLTDLIHLLVGKGHKVSTCILSDFEEARGVNDRLQLAAASRAIRIRINEKLMKEGVTMVDPDTTYIDQGVSIGADTIVYPQTIIEGESTVGKNCVLGPSTHLKDAALADGVTCRASVMLESSAGEGALIGPYSYLRPGTKIGPGVKIGDFVEIKNSSIGEKAKIPHLSYVGDASVEAEVNLGAGTIVVNFDGKAKHKTVIEEGAFVGCNSNLIAPLKIGKKAFIAAGSTVTRDVPSKALFLARPPETIKEGMAIRFLGNKEEKQKEKKQEKER